MAQYLALRKRNATGRDAADRTFSVACRFRLTSSGMDGRAVFGTGTSSSFGSSFSQSANSRILSPRAFKAAATSKMPGTPSTGCSSMPVSSHSFRSGESGSAASSRSILSSAALPSDSTDRALSQERQASRTESFTSPGIADASSASPSESGLVFQVSRIDATRASMSRVAATAFSSSRQASRRACSASSSRPRASRSASRLGRIPTDSGNESKRSNARRAGPRQFVGSRNAQTVAANDINKVDGPCRRSPR